MRILYLHTANIIHRISAAAITANARHETTIIAKFRAGIIKMQSVHPSIGRERDGPNLTPYAPVPLSNLMLLAVKTFSECFPDRWCTELLKNTIKQRGSSVSKYCALSFQRIRIREAVGQRRNDKVQINSTESDEWIRLRFIQINLPTKFV